MPVTLNDMRNRVFRNLNRHNVPDELCDEWITDTMRTILQVLITPMEDAFVDYTVVDGFNGRINIPNNLLDLYSIQVDGQALTRRAVTDVKNAQRRKSGLATFYTVEGGQYLIGPIPMVGSKVLIYFRADNYNVKEDNDTCQMFNIMPDLVMFGALERASAWEGDDNGMVKWNSAFNKRVLEYQAQANRDKLRYASIAPAYNSNGEW